MSGAPFVDCHSFSVRISMKYQVSLVFESIMEKNVAPFSNYNNFRYCKYKLYKTNSI
jgi:hypothetical protein